MLIQKYLVQKGICSRREAEAFLKAGLLLVNGKPAKPGVPLTPDDVVTLAPAAKLQLDTKITVAVYKPRGIMCSTNTQEGRNVFDIFPEYKHLNMVGRLDKESEGLLLLSNNGLVTKKITGDQHETEKEYEVATQEKVFKGKLQPMIAGMKLSDGPTLPAHVEIVDNHTFRLTIREGRNHQVRRMCAELGLSVLSLKRIRIGSILLGNLRPGSARKLTNEEVAKLLEV